MERMVDFEYWFEGVVATCQLISSPTEFERVWIFGDSSITSIHYPDELFEQMLGDLNLEECHRHFADKLREMGAFDAVAEFTSILVDLETTIRSKPTLEDSRTLLTSQEWSVLQSAAKRVADLPCAAGRGRPSSN